MASLIWGSQKSLPAKQYSNFFTRKATIANTFVPPKHNFVDARTFFNIKNVPVKKNTSYKTKCVVTAYTPFPEENGGTGITRMGRVPKKGTIAVDPRLIPIGSKIYVPGYGWGVADDTGGKINGKHIDICLNSRHQATRWGRQKIDIIVFPGKHKLWKSKKHP